MSRSSRRLWSPTSWSRRALQIAVLALAVVTPVAARYVNYLNAHQLDKVMTRWDGSVQGELLQATDATIRTVVPDVVRGDNLRRDRTGALEAAATMRGTTWSFELFGVSLTDPLAALESALTSRSLPVVLLLGVLIPVLFTLLLGRVFCSWICPIGFLLELTGKLRGLLRFLELPPGKVRLWAGNKYLIVAVGLAIAAGFGLPFLGYLYPPALLGRELHNGVTVLFDRAEDGMLGFSAAGLTLASWFLVAIAAVEIVFGPRLWCRSLCPGGAVYAVIGRFRLLRVQRTAANCTECGNCVTACDMGLNPMRDKTGMECDNCGACIRSCGDEALAFTVLGRGAKPARTLTEVNG